MIKTPEFFDRIRSNAARRWQQLEADPELAGPWHQLFKQVQSPRHVLSELLQNADDAGATNASVDIVDGFFVFSHNGEDFREEHFASLCRFGYSNKRALHTIGFRGIGFKSTFSLGETVQLKTPTLSVSFDKSRFTEPRWMDLAETHPQLTQVRVQIGDQNRLRELEKNLKEWLASPVSLLFFKNIRAMRIGDSEVCWSSCGNGPVAGSEWMALNNGEKSRFLLVRSDAEAFPEDCLAEIRKERLLGVDQDMDFPPCKVEIVLGAKGRLYVVLPTGVETSLPFACNAPFIQDPARLKIKDPETSPTNQWLLGRIGRLAATSMLEWLDSGSIELPDRASAYDFLPDVDRNDNSLDGSCATLVEEAVEQRLVGATLLLGADNRLYPVGDCIALAHELAEVWSPEHAARLFDDQGRQPLSTTVSEMNRKKLLHWRLLDEVSREKVLLTLQAQHLPKPETWRQLLLLWAYLSPEFTRYRFGFDYKALRILPVQGHDVLYSSNEVVRLGDKRLLQSDEDWDFIAGHMRVLNQNWTRYLSEQRRQGAAGENFNSRSFVDAAYAANDVLRVIDLRESSDVSDVVEQVSSHFFASETLTLKDCVRFAQIAAKLGATIGSSFRYVTRDGVLRSHSDSLLYDRDGFLESILAPEWCDVHFLNESYFSAEPQSCSREEWFSWLSSERSRLAGFPPLVTTESNINRRPQFLSELSKRGFDAAINYPYVTSFFQIVDWDFAAEHWEYWTEMAKDRPQLWGEIMERIFSQPKSYWAGTKSARALQVGSTGSRKSVTHEQIHPAWILKFRALPCLRDTRGFHHEPGDLLRRTPETESLIDVEPFVHGLLDNETTRPLLDLLGVRSSPPGPNRLLDRLRALAKADKPPVHEVEKWYRRLDQMANNCTTSDMRSIVEAFQTEKILLTEEGVWSNAGTVFLSMNDGSLPGIDLIRIGVRDLMLWRKVGVADQPSADLLIKWLDTLPSGVPLPIDDLKRVRTILSQHPVRVWTETRHWLNLASEWVDIDTLCYGLSMQSLVAYKHLHDSIKQKTADFQRMSVELIELAPFDRLPALASIIEERITRPVDSSEAFKVTWIRSLGSALERIEQEDSDESVRLRALATRLSATKLCKCDDLEIVPYIAGMPVGTARSAEAVWLDELLYTEDRPPAKLQKAIVQALGSPFKRQDIVEAISACYERSSDYVHEYMQANFKLLLVNEAGPVQEPASPEPAVRNEIAVPVGEQSAFPSKQTSANQTDPNPGEAREMAEFTEEQVRADPDVVSDSEEIKVVAAKQKVAKVNMIERFARAMGFRADGEGRFLKEDGTRLIKAPSSRFSWEKYNAHGELLQYYLPKEHSLEREPLQIEADIWGLLEQRPKLYSLILCDPDGQPIEVSGEKLCNMRDEGVVKVFPATYRLVLA